MPLNKYRVFAKIAETGNMRKAAREMMYTQQAVSRIVKCLEDDYGFPLFIRERDGVRLTPQAEALLPSVNKLIEDEDKLLDVIEDLQVEAGLIKPVHISTCGSIVIGPVNETLATLKESNPGISFCIHYNADNDRTLAKLRAREVCCAIMVEGCQGEMNFEPVFREKYYAVLPKEHPLGNRDIVSIEELKKYPNVITPDAIQYDELMSNADNHTMVVDEEIMMLSIISSSGAVGIMSGIKQFNLEHGLAVIPLVEDQYRVLGIATRPNEDLDDNARIFIDAFKKIAAEY